MMKKLQLKAQIRTVLTLVLITFSGFVASASHDKGEHDDHGHAKEGGHDHHLVPKAKFDNDYILHHVIDSHDWHLFDIPAEDGMYKPVSIPLPVILYADGGVHTFMSSDFEHGHAKVKKGEVTFELDKWGKVIATKNGKELSVLDFSITKSVVAMFVTGILLLLIFGAVAKFYKRNGPQTAPRGIAGFVEPLILFVRDDIVVPNIGEKKAGKFMPYLLTVFFFIWITNLVGLLPFGFNLTGNLMVTFALAMFTFVLTTINANKGYWGHIFAPPGVPVALLPIMIPIEVAGMFIKPAALMIRLFANITAGHIVVMSLIGLMFKMESIGWAGLSVPMTLFVMGLELLVAALQAYVFTMLSALFIGMAVAEDHH